MQLLIQPVILSGGAGTRLWPLSRESHPKQFTNLLGSHSLLQNTALRVQDSARYTAPLIVCNTKHRFMMASQLDEVDVVPSGILLEPFARNTAAAIAISVLAAARRAPEQIVFIMPSDHIIEDVDLLHQTVEQGAKLAQMGKIVTFGITPDHADTNFGYIRQGTRIAESVSYEISSFIEKPDATTAAGYVAEGGYHWNSGMFMARADMLLHEFEHNAPEVLAACKASFSHSHHDLDFIRLDPEAFAKAPSIMFDRAIMEKQPPAALIPVSNMGWSDVGNWNSLADITDKDESNNTLVGRVVAADSKGCYIRSDKHLTTVLGLENMVVVTTEDAVLVAPRNRAHEVGKLVEQLKKDNYSEATHHVTGYRPWGQYETLTLGGRFHVKRITVKPGASLSLQKHLHRSEHWTVVEGTAQVTVGDKVSLMTENQSIYVPLGETHRLENPGKLPLTIIEVQTGAYLGEDDIIRLEDVYAREKDAV